MVSRPLTKGLLDGGLLHAFERLSLDKQVEITKQIGTDRATVLKDMSALYRAW